jgi:nucleoside 2-deoxyribosyltransferase
MIKNPCPECKGEGTVFSDSSVTDERDCPVCGGRKTLEGAIDHAKSSPYAKKRLIEMGFLKKDPIKIYLAGPFFYPAQLQIILQLEEALEAAGYVVLSPRKFMVLKENATKAQRDAVFADNVAKMMQANLIVAQIASYGERGHKEMEKKFSQIIDGLSSDQNGLAMAMSHVKNEILSLMNSKAWPTYSDEGTIWELGCAYQMGKKIILYSPDVTTRINVMLSQAAHGVIEGSIPALLESIPKILDGELICYQGMTR